MGLASLWRQEEKLEYLKPEKLAFCVLASCLAFVAVNVLAVRLSGKCKIMGTLNSV